MHPTSATPGQPVTSPKLSIPTDTLRNCIEECLNCHAVCQETVNHCLQQGGDHAEAGHIRLLLDCVEICQASANFMLRGSPFHVRTCAACSEVCRACAEDCEQMGTDGQMRVCAETCLRCAESCASMALTEH